MKQLIDEVFLLFWQPLSLGELFTVAEPTHDQRVDIVGIVEQ